MAVDLTIKKGDTRTWRFALSDADGSAVNLTSGQVKFRMLQHEWASDVYFDRDSGGTGSDYILISDATGGIVTVTPTSSDWTEISDDYGIYVAEFQITDANSVVEYVKDIKIRVEEPLW